MSDRPAYGKHIDDMIVEALRDGSQLTYNELIDVVFGGHYLGPCDHESDAPRYPHPEPQTVQMHVRKLEKAGVLVHDLIPQKASVRQINVKRFRLASTHVHTWWVAIVQDVLNVFCKCGATHMSTMQPILLDHLVELTKEGG